ncbi:Dynein_light domain-containing protein [Cephalotus follicularis]|uniref:Dynein light chain n=1 Tax=Cephalotus follicularis TaxID=3775 RepID=A0A1Q3CFV3_CEPFO|nr:Dynein_light domain-containing protein [Cephalotus follicularis]
MERSKENGKRRRRRVERSKEGVLCAPRRTLSLPPVVGARPPVNEVKLAALVVDLNIRLRLADMPAAMQERVFSYTKPLLDANAQGRSSLTHIAMCLKKEFDALYGPAWHCIVGKSFGSFVTHSTGGFIYFSCDKLCFLLFKTEVRPLSKLPSLLTLKNHA